MAEKKKTADKKPSRKAPAGMKWVVMTSEEMENTQIKDGNALPAGGKIVGYDPKTKEALVKL